MAEDRELMEAELQALMEVSADFSKGLSTVASRMRAIKSYLNSNVQTKTASSSRAKIRTRDSATSPIIFRTTRCTSVSPDRFDNSAPRLNILDTSSIKIEHDEEIYDDHGSTNHAAAEPELERIQQQRRAICNVGDICSVTRGALNVMSPGGSAGGVTTTRILSTTGGQIGHKASLLKAANAVAHATSVNKSGKPSGLIYILKPMGNGSNGKPIHAPVTFGTVKKMRKILPNQQNVITMPPRIGNMSIVMDRSRQKISPKLKVNFRREDSNSTTVQIVKEQSMEEDLLYAIQTTGATPEKKSTPVKEPEKTTSTEKEKPTLNSVTVGDAIEEVIVEIPSPAPVKVVTEENLVDNSAADTSSALIDSSELVISEVSSDAQLNDVSMSSNPEIADEFKDQVIVAKKRGRTRKKSNHKTEEERKEYNRLRQAKYRAIKRQSAEAFLQSMKSGKRKYVRRGGRRSTFVKVTVDEVGREEEEEEEEEQEEVVEPNVKKPLILRQKREKLSSSEKLP